ncbi:MAG: chemotaxis protein CheA [Spirochaeta sp.]
MQDKFRETFKIEALELLQTLESVVLDLESDPRDRDSIASVFRVMHTIKGSGAMFGYLHISRFTHELETVMDEIRQGRMQVEPELVDILLTSRDHIRVLLEESDPPPADLQEKSEELIQRVRVFSGAKSASAEKQVSSQSRKPQVQPSHELHSALVTYRIRFVPHAGLYRNGTNPLALLKELHGLGECTCIPYVPRMPPLDMLDPEDCYLQWDILLTTDLGTPAISDVFMFVLDDCELKIDPVDDLSYDELAPAKRLGQILVERGVVSEDKLEEALGTQRRLGQVLQERGVESYEIQSALEEQDHIKRSRKKIQEDAAQQSVRVSSDKLDVMIDLVGELVTLQARLQQTSVEIENPHLLTLSENLQRITNELRDSTLSVRMLPIGAVFAKFRRLVRDISRQLGKEVDLVTLGGDTEMDKTVLEQLTDPLLHIIRNAVDHGIELPEVRKAAGKSSTGTVTLEALHSGANVVITITDDGKGLDRGAILKKAVEKGLVESDANLTDAQIAGLLTMPGFSTASEVTELSGRGVGMDVVRQQVEGLGGTLDIGGNNAGGTAITLVLPLTLAIIDGLLIRVGDTYYIIPLSSVEECLEWTAGTRSANTAKEDSGQQVISSRGSLLSIISLRHYLDIADSAPQIQQIVVVNHRGQKAGLIVDQVIGGHQTVIKNLGMLYRDIPGISGASIMGDGSVALILDIQRLTAEVSRSEYGN